MHSLTLLGTGYKDTLRWVARLRLVAMPKQANETQVHVVPAKWLEIKIKHAKEKTSVGKKKEGKKVGSKAAIESKVQAVQPKRIYTFSKFLLSIRA